jgi:hypothetical protein
MIRLSGTPIRPLSLVLWLSILVFISLLLGSCGGGPTFPPPASRQLVALAVEPSKAEVVQGGTVPFTATGTFDQAPTTETNTAAQWASSETTLATVDANTGVATCLAVGGPITIMAAAPGKGGMVCGSGVLNCLVAPASAVTFDPNHLLFQCRGVINAGCQCLTSKTTILTNNTGALLTINSITVSGDSFVAASNTCGSRVDAGQSCSITVGWTPASKQIYSGALSVSDSDPGSPQSVFLRADKLCNPPA